MPAAAHAADRLTAVIEATGSISCVGLDPRPGLLPPAIREAALAAHGPGHEAVAAAFLDVNRRLIDAVAGNCAAVKPQVACYEAYGWRGMRCLEASIRHASAAGIPVIIDAKRGDIGSTATHYRQAWLGSAPDLDPEAASLAGAGGDWLTVNGYLGSDGVLPFLAEEPDGCGIFVLVKTSNPGSAELQGQVSGDGLVMHRMAELVHTWGASRLGSCGLSDLGAVVGATYPDEARQLRELMPNTLFLVPGYGAQGGSAADALAGRRSGAGLAAAGLLVNSSRGISAAWQTHSSGDLAIAARAALQAMNEDLAAA